MRSLVLKTIVVVSLVALLFSCIEEFSVKKGVSQMNSEIVIQGRILSENESVIYVSRTQPFGSQEMADTISDAKVFIIGQNGYQSETAKFDTENNCYLIDTKHLLTDTYYALQVEIDNEIYQSEFLSLQSTPEIENVTYKERMDGISIHVSSQNNDEGSQYYMWTYEEDWEFHAPVDFLGVQGIPVYSKSFYPLGWVNNMNPYLYCWGHENSSEISLYSTKDLDMNIVKNHELLRIPIDDIRISYIYSVTVKQFSISEEAYNYYHQLELLTEENSGLFSPMPIELVGNVKCISNPSIKVRGYVLASNVKTKRLFVYESDFKEIHSEYDSGCIVETPDPFTNLWQYVWEQNIAKNGFVAITKDGYIHGNDYLWNKLYHRTCVDCRAVKGATKKRPDFWPNNHE